MKKLIRNFVLTIVLAFVEIVSASSYDFKVGGIFYNITYRNTVEVTSLKEESAFNEKDTYIGVVTIPSSVTYEGKTYSVTSIGNNAFRRTNLTLVEIPNSVTSIGSCAFSDCDGLTSVTIPNSVTSIDKKAFSNCDKLESVKIQGSVSTIKEETFCFCKALTSVELPNSVTSIEKGAFKCCKLTALNIPKSLTSIGEEAFYGCHFTSLILPNTVISIGKGAFNSCSKLTTIKLPNSITSIDEWVFGYCKSLSTVEIPSSIVSIGKDAFSNCKSLTTIKLPNSITTIAEGAFFGCSLLTSIEIPYSVKSIGKDAFNQCGSLTSFTGKFASPDHRCLIIDGTLTCFADAGLTSYSIPNFVTAIGDKAFSYCHKITKIEIPNSVTSIGDCAFTECSFTSIKLPNSIKTIADMAFFNCRNLTSIEIPNSVNSIGGDVFLYCENLSTFTGKYASADHRCLIVDGVLICFAPAGLTSYTIPSAANSVGWNAFGSCHELTSVTIPNSVTSLEKYAFSNCSRLISVEIPNSVKSIDSRAFEFCRKLSSVNIPNSVMLIGEEIFDGCENLPVENGIRYADTYLVEVVSKNQTYYSIKEGTRWIGTGAFRDCYKLTSIDIPNSVISIGEYAFAGCSSLSSFTGKFASDDHHCLIVDGVLKSFAPSGLTSYTIPNTVTAIGNTAFLSCNELTSVVIPNSVTSIGKKAFDNCYKLKYVEIPNSVRSIGKDAFSLENDANVLLADGLTEDRARNLYDWGNKKLKYKFDPKAVPILNVSDIVFADNGNKKIDASELCSVKMKVTNSGKGAAVGCVAKVKIGGVSGVSAQDVKLPNIAPGKTVDVTIELTADANIKDGKANISVSVDEPNGFGCDPTLLTVETKAFEAPRVLIADYSVTGASSGTLEKRKPFDLQVLLQNVAQGMADDVDVSISVPQNVFITEGDEKTHFAKLDGGETKSMVYQLLVNNNYSANTIPVKFTLKEKHGKYAESRTIELALNQSLAQNKIEIKGENAAPQGNISIAKIEGGVKLSDVDLQIPETTGGNDKTFAVVICNEDYQEVEKVPNALNDGSVFAEYCKKTLGLPQTNVHLVKNATLNNMKREVSWLSQVTAAYKGKAKIIFYYAGHGVPDDNTKTAYLLPVDGIGTDASTGYSLGELYSTLGKLQTEQTVVLLDACFSGSQRGDGMLASARGVAIKAKDEAAQGKMVVLSAAQGDETAYPYNEKGHGLFTYFLLKKLQETKGETTLEELSSFIIENVSQKSIVVNGKSQTPTVNASPSLADSWKGWSLY